MAVGWLMDRWSRDVSNNCYLYLNSSLDPHVDGPTIARGRNLMPVLWCSVFSPGDIITETEDLSEEERRSLAMDYDEEEEEALHWPALVASLRTARDRAAVRR